MNRLYLILLVLAVGCESATDTKKFQNEVVQEQNSDHYEQLKNLEWLLGNWHDEDEDADIKFNTRWDKHKNFLIQKFDVKLEGEDELEGYQIIGWDPANKKVVSWIFDSDGGFGIGNWSKQEDSWNVVTNYTLTDGGKASSTSVYAPKDENSYTFTSIDREVDGEILPDVEPIKVIKEK